MNRQNSNLEMTGCPVDWADVYDRIGDVGIIAEFAVSFLRNSQTLMLSLKSAVNARSIDQIELYAHALKGSASNMGAITLAKKSWLLEKDAADKNIDNAAELLSEIEGEYLVLKSLLEYPDWVERAKRAAEVNI
jgi:HPt (histidine-containing phosphotransfer) domain-containing protein